MELPECLVHIENVEDFENDLYFTVYYLQDNELHIINGKIDENTIWDYVRKYPTFDYLIFRNIFIRAEGKKEKFFDEMKTDLRVDKDYFQLEDDK